MEMASFPRTLVHIYQTKRCHIPEALQSACVFFTRESKNAFRYFDTQQIN